MLFPFLKHMTVDLPCDDIIKFDNTFQALKMFFPYLKFQIIMIFAKKTQNYTKWILRIKRGIHHSYIVLFSFLGNVFIEKTLTIEFKYTYQVFFCEIFHQI